MDSLSSTLTKVKKLSQLVQIYFPFFPLFFSATKQNGKSESYVFGLEE